VPLYGVVAKPLTGLMGAKVELSDDQVNVIDPQMWPPASRATALNFTLLLIEAVGVLGETVTVATMQGPPPPPPPPPQADRISRFKAKMSGKEPRTVSWGKSLGTSFIPLR